MKFELPLLGVLRFNPIVSFFSITLIWTFVIICIIYREATPFYEWKSYVAKNFTWVYIGSQDVWVVLIIILYFSKYSDIKLGKPNDKPEFNDITWFVMLFGCGTGTGLIFFGVGEPIIYYTEKNRYSIFVL